MVECFPRRETFRLLGRFFGRSKLTSTGGQKKIFFDLVFLRVTKRGKKKTKKKQKTSFLFSARCGGGIPDLLGVTSHGSKTQNICLPTGISCLRGRFFVGRFDLNLFCQKKFFCVPKNSLGFSLNGVTSRKKIFFQHFGSSLRKMLALF